MKKRLQSILLGFITLTVISVSIASTMMPTERASAGTGETYTWATNNSVTVSGGDLAPGTFTLTGLPSGVSIGGVLTHKTGCTFKVNIILGLGGTTGTLSIPTVIGAPGTGGTGACNGTTVQGFLGAVSIGGTRPGPGGTPETPGQQIVSISVFSPKPSAESPATVVATLTGNGATKTITMNKDDSADSNNPDPGARVVNYQGGFTGVAPGNYKVCLNAIATACKDFTKTKYQVASLTFGENLANRSIEVTVEVTYIGGAVAQTAGPATLSLKQNGAEIESISTTAASYEPTDAQKAAQGTITVTVPLDMVGTFGDVTKGNYTICVQNTTVCQNVVKEEDLALKIKIKLDGQNAQNLLGNGTDDAERPVCETSPNPLSWILCPIFNGLARLSDWIIQNLIVPFIQPSPIGLNPDDKSTGAVYKIWSTMRVYADIILVILLLIAVISQAYGGGILEVYTAKKMLPRILIAAILINTSIYIVAFAIDMSVLIGSSIADIITAPLVQTGQFKFDLTNTQIFAITGITVFLTAAIKVMIGIPEIAAILPYLVVLAVLPAFLAIMGIFVTLVLLQGLYMALTIFSSIAFALYAFPNTEKYFQKWWDWLLRALMVYPIFMTIVALSDVFTVLIQKANGG